jgi:hypothetical protein
MTGFSKSGNNGCRVKQDPGRQDNIADTLQIVFLKKQIRKIRSGAEHVSQNRENYQNFHLPALGGFRVQSSGFIGSACDEAFG